MFAGALDKADGNQENGSNSSPGHFFINPANSFKKDGDQSNSSLNESALPVNITTNQAEKTTNSTASESIGHRNLDDSLYDHTYPSSYIDQTKSVIPQSNSNTSLSSDSSNTLNWQSTKSTVRDRLSCLFDRETLADVHFIVGRGSNQVRVPAHKFVLSIGSAVFDRMFNGQLATTASEIEIPDIPDPAAFLTLLRFLYTDEVQIGPETVMATLYTAKKYAVPALENACVDFLKANLSSDNAFMLLTQARLFDENVLAQMCLDTIDKNTEEALEAEGFLDIDHDTLVSVLERDMLLICEVFLFKSILKWARAECARQNLTPTPENQRKALGKAIYMIRFPLMTMEEFALEVAQSGILTHKECVDLFLHFVINPKPPIQFPDVPRSCVRKEQVVSRFGRTDLRWGYSGTSDRIRFVVDRRIYVVGFGLYGSIHGPSDYECLIKIIHTTTGKELASNSTNFSCDGSSKTFRVMFKKPVEIHPNVNYTACATLKGSDSHYGTSGNRAVAVDLHGSGKITFQFSYSSGCNNGTCVEDGQIPEIIFCI
ncbi:BTB/POZ domain-containing protein 1-like [Brevipalpus obovatus]|uniref:BTB/POZ domain-containing protein 1-like n=1 Tax=Brevipalpus obovatus TaxID=246614 RepID=UPI003D9ED0BB